MGQLIIIAAILAILFLVGMLVGGIFACASEPIRRYRIGFGILVLIGFFGAIPCAVFIKYQGGATWRMTGVPIPIETLHLENGEWVNYGSGLNLIIDLVVVTSLIPLPMSSLLILRLGARYKKWRYFNDGRCQICGYDLHATLGRCPECGATPPIGSKREK